MPLVHGSTERFSQVPFDRRRGEWQMVDAVKLRLTDPPPLWADAVSGSVVDDISLDGCQWLEFWMLRFSVADFERRTPTRAGESRVSHRGAGERAPAASSDSPDSLSQLLGELCDRPFGRRCSPHLARALDLLLRQPEAPELIVTAGETRVKKAFRRVGRSARVALASVAAVRPERRHKFDRQLDKSALDIKRYGSYVLNSLVDYPEWWARSENKSPAWFQVISDRTKYVRTWWRRDSSSPWFSEAFALLEADDIEARWAIEAWQRPLQVLSMAHPHELHRIASAFVTDLARDRTHHALTSWLSAFRVACLDAATQPTGPGALLGSLGVASLCSGSALGMGLLSAGERRALKDASIFQQLQFVAAEWAPDWWHWIQEARHRSEKHDESKGSDRVRSMARG